MNPRSPYSSPEEQAQYYKKQRDAREYQRRREQAKRKVLLIMLVLAALLILLVVKGCGAIINALHDEPATETGISALFQSPEIQVGDLIEDLHRENISQLDNIYQRRQSSKAV